MNTLFLNATSIPSQLLMANIPEERLAFVKIKYNDKEPFPRLTTSSGDEYCGDILILQQIDAMMPVLHMPLNAIHQFTEEGKDIISWIASKKLNKLIKRKQGDSLYIVYEDKKYQGSDAIKKRFENFKQELLKLNEPTFLEKVKTLKEASFTALKDWSDNKEIEARPETIAARHAICWGEEPCMYMKDTGNCLKCGCNMKIKTTWRGQFCPIGKWEIEEQNG